MKICPHCAEPVKTEASKCKHCGSALVVDAKAVEAQDRNRRAFWIIVMLVASFFVSQWAVTRQGDISRPALLGP